MPKSPTKRRPLTRAALSESAWSLFREKGFHATTISDIVERAGLTRGAFYSNYRDKEELFLALYDEHTDRLLAGLKASDAEASSDRDPIAQLGERIAGRTAEERRWFLVSMEFTLHAARTPAVAEQLAVHEDRLARGLTEVLAAALDGAGAEPSLPADELARLLIALFEGVTAHQVIHGNSSLTENFTPLLLRALTTPADSGS
ncbi:TetR/AcrR family transcriptional regulator [Streptomyces sp. NPDC001904]|uniref:TetR/AcrR family transcriptional regulator n=1 Tax=Streptomyces sp. NPDC001904 TaxID=3154531 RepID=UPI0033204ECC